MLLTEDEIVLVNGGGRKREAGEAIGVFAAVGVGAAVAGPVGAAVGGGLVVCGIILHSIFRRKKKH